MGTDRLCRVLKTILPLLLAVGLVPGNLQSQAVQDTTRPSPGDRIVPTNNVVLTGYGTVGYLYRTGGDNRNEFNASFSPVFLFQFQDKILFEAELEFDVEDGVTETGLEYAQVDYIANDHLVLVGGKFLLPFGVFGPRLHPTWINKFPTPPPIYGHHTSEFGAEPIIPVLADVGVMARAPFQFGRTAIALNAYVTNGPAEEDHDDGDGDGGIELPEVGFPASSSDNNKNKMVGGRVDFALPPFAELNISYMTGKYDEQNVLDMTGWNIAWVFRHRAMEFRGEYLQTRQETETFEGFPTLRRHGLYAQAAYRIRGWQPVLRWTQSFDDQLDGVAEENGARQFALGLNYWFSPSLALMAGYEINTENGPEIENDRFVVHFAFGF